MVRLIGLSGALIVGLAVAASAGGWISCASAQTTVAGQAPDRGLTVTIGKDAAAQTIRLYDNSHALVIGIDEYTNGWPRLSNAVSDAQAVATALTARGFNVTLRLNLKSRELKEELERFFIIRGADPDARLFVWYAGHGESIAGEGFLIPADAPVSDNEAAFRLSALALRRFGEFIRQAKSSHVLAVFDSCFAGTIFASSRDRLPPAITRATARPVRQFLSSGDAGQKVTDDGLFRRLFLGALSGDEAADANGDGYVTATELGFFLEARITNLTEGIQTPRYGKLRDPDYDKGDFVWAVTPDGGEGARARSEPVSPAPESPARAAFELAFWQSIQNSTNVADFEAYLAQYPDGAFAQLARNRLSSVKSAETTVAAVAPSPVPEISISPMDEQLVALRNANVRSAPSTNANKLETLTTGTEVTVTGKVEGTNWYRISRKGRTEGYVYAPLIGEPKPVTESPMDVTMWAMIKDSSSPSDFETFLESFPDSALAPYARYRLDATRPPPEPPADAAAWAAIEDGSDAASFEAYLQQFPDGAFADLARAKIEALDRRQSIAIPTSPGERQPPSSSASRESDSEVATALAMPKEPDIASRNYSGELRRLSGEELRSLFSTELRALGNFPPPVYISTLASPYPTNSVVINYQLDGEISATWTVHETGTWEIKDDLLCMSWESASNISNCYYLVRDISSFILYDETKNKYGTLIFSSLVNK